MSRWLSRLLLCSLLLAAIPAAAQSDCGPNLRCGQVPWKLPVMPILVSPTPFATSVPQVIEVTPLPTDQSAYVIFCDDLISQQTAYKQVVSNTRPAAYWPMDETEGTTLTDASGHNHNGTYTGASLNAFISAPLAGGAAPNFDGVNDYASAGNMTSVMNSGQFTVSLWLHKSPYFSWNSGGTLVYFGDSQVFQMRRSGSTLVVTSGASSASGTLSALEGEWWIHVVAVINRATGGGQSARLYINGANVATANTAPGTFTTASTFYIGRTPTGSYYPGGLAQVAVFNRALSTSEIANLADNSPEALYTPTPNPNCDPSAESTFAFDASDIIDTMATLQSLPTNQIGVENPQAGFDLYSGTATFFSYVLGIQSVNLGIFTPIIGFIFWSFFSFVGIKVAFILLPIVAALIGVVRRIVQLVLDFLPF